MYVKPAPGLKVRDPVTKQLYDEETTPAEGILVSDDDLYWARLLRDGDVVTVPVKADKRSAK